MEARILLAEMRIRREEPKLEALCRWVRDLDVISGMSTRPDGASQVAIERSAEDKERLSVLDAVLRSTGLVDTNAEAFCHSSSPCIAVQTIWDLRPSASSLQVYESVRDKTIFAAVPSSLPQSLRVIETTEGRLRKPPNHHPAILYTSTPNAIPLSPESPSITYRPHPIVPGLGLALNVLSPAECTAIIAAGESVNFPARRLSAKTEM